MSALTEQAPAKINLGLTLGPLREDGRHEIATVMQPVGLCDRVRLLPAALGTARDEVHCPGVSGENLALAALSLFRERTGWDGAPVRIEIDKRIPVAAGMAGGSADAGAVLRLAARAAGRRQSRDDGLMKEIAAALGSDVPSQLRPGRYLATGAGERLHALPDVPPFGVLIMRATEGLPTADVYREADRLGLPRSASQLEARRAELVAALAAGARMPPGELLANDLEPAATSLRPELADKLDALRRAGAEHAMVCGSGPTVAGLFPDLERARAAGVSLGGYRPPPIAVEPWYPSLSRPEDL